MAPLSTNLTPDPSLALPNKTALLLAQHQRLISSWLPPPNPTKTKPVSENSILHPQNNTEPAPLSPSEADFFSTPLPELCGIGSAPPPTTDGEANGRGKELSTNEKLQKRLLGKDYLQNIKHGQKQDSERGATHTGSKPKPKQNQPASGLKRTANDGSSGEEEETGRSSLGKSVSRKKKQRKENPTQMATEFPQYAGEALQKLETIGATAEAEPAEEPHPSKKRGSNYLDELLVDRSLKKKRKKSKKEDHTQMQAQNINDMDEETPILGEIGSTAEPKPEANPEIEPATHPPKKNGSNDLDETSPKMSGETQRGGTNDALKAEAGIQETVGEAETPLPQTGDNSQDEIPTELSPEKRKKSRKKKKRKRNLRTG